MRSGLSSVPCCSSPHIECALSQSEPLAALLGVEQLSRPQIVKGLWDHIKANNMQNPENKKEIICDDSFRSIFKCDRIDMFKMNKELGRYVLLHPSATALTSV